MSETLSPQETIYEPLSEASDNDVREAVPVVAEDTAVETPVETVEATEPAALAEPAETEEVAEDEDKTRAARLARDLREQRRRARQLELENQTLRGQRQAQPNEAMEMEIANRAAAMAAQQVVNQRANEIYSEGTKEFGRVEFDESVRAVNESFGQAMPIVIDSLTEIPNAQKLIQHLADNPDVMDNLALLPPHRLGVALASQAAKLNTPKPKPLSKAPAPIRPIATQGASEPEQDMEKMSMEQLAALWDRRDFEKRFR